MDMVYLLLANGFEEVEALTPLDYLRRCEGVEIETVGIGGPVITGSHGISVVCDKMVEDVELASAQMLILPGGMPGTLNLEHSSEVQAGIDGCYANGGILAAICAAPSILGHKGLLEGRRAVCYPGFEEQLLGAQVGTQPVCVDGNIVTARGAGVANQFGFALAELLCGEKQVQALKAAVQWVG